jgi:gliding motility-associated lipoprotein GldH
MRAIVAFLILTAFLTACDDTRVFEKNADLEEHVWMASYKPEFDFRVTDTAARYNLYCNIRNSVSYPYSRIFFNFYLQDSIGLTLNKNLINYTLFEPTSGEPQGTSGLGDIFDQQIPILKNHKFPYRGTHRIKFEQFMRKDTLEGVFAVGLRVEKALHEK